MAIRDIVFYPDPILRETCQTVEEIDEETLALLDDLGASMYAHKGVGLAAPQIGSTARAVVVDVEQREGTPRLVELVNPELVEVSEELSEFEEGCLSFPGESELVTRPARVVVRALGRDGEQLEIEADGILATALQHELDHLEGTLFIDHISRLKRSMIERRMKKRARRAAS